jgi:hypothetical protein
MDCPTPLTASAPTCPPSIAQPAELPYALARISPHDCFRIAVEPRAGERFGDQAQLAPPYRLPRCGGSMFAIRFAGRFPGGMFDYVGGVLRAGDVGEAYAFVLVTNQYPPSGLRC